MTNESSGIVPNEEIVPKSEEILPAEEAGIKPKLEVKSEPKPKSSFWSKFKWRGKEKPSKEKPDPNFIVPKEEDITTAMDKDLDSSKNISKEKSEEKAPGAVKKFFQKVGEARKQAQEDFYERQYMTDDEIAGEDKKNNEKVSYETLRKETLARRKFGKKNSDPLSRRQTMKIPEISEEKSEEKIDEPEEIPGENMVKEEFGLSKNRSSKKVKLESVVVGDAGISFEAGEVLSKANQTRFEKLSEEGKSLFKTIYESLYKIPLVNRIVGKMEIAYNQFWIDRHEEKAVDKKEQMDALDIKMSAVQASRDEIQATIDELKKNGMSGVLSLERKLKELDRRESDIMADKDKKQSKAEKRENKVKLYTNRRDKIADKLIGYYDEKIAPMNEEIRGLEECRKKAEDTFASSEVRNKEKLERLSALEKRKETIIRSLELSGESKSEARNSPAVKELEKMISEGRKSVEKARERFKDKIQKINKEIAKVDKKANPKRDRRETFVRIKNERPIELGLKKRTLEGQGTANARRKLLEAEASGERASLEERALGLNQLAQTLSQNPEILNVLKLETAGKAISASKPTIIAGQDGIVATLLAMAETMKKQGEKNG